MIRRLPLGILLSLTLTSPLAAAGPVYAAGASYSYSDLADLALAAPVVAHAVVTDTIRLEGADAVGTPPGKARLFVRATISELLRGPVGMASEVNFLADVPLDTRGRPPKLRKADVLLFARPVTAGPTGALQLVAPDGMLGWTPALDTRLRGILTAAVDPQAPPHITGVNNAFHVRGSLPGESETQIFLATAGGRPVSLAVLRRPQEQPRWAVALSEMVDEAAAPPAPDTLLWYRLACELPPTLPDSSVASLGPDDAAGAQADYQFVLARLGACGRTRVADARPVPAAPESPPAESPEGESPARLEMNMPQP